MTAPTPDGREAPPGAFGASLALMVDPSYVRVCGGGALTADPPVTDACVPHTPAPSGYAAWHEWAERKSRTHEQHQCPGCGLWQIWMPEERR